MVLAVDSSGSIEENGGDGNWQKVLNLLDDLLNTIANEGNDVNFGMVEFSGEGRLIYNLQQRGLNEVIVMIILISFLFLYYSNCSRKSVHYGSWELHNLDI